MELFCRALCVHDFAGREGVTVTILLYSVWRSMPYCQTAPTHRCIAIRHRQRQASPRWLVERGHAFEYSVLTGVAEGSTWSSRRYVQI
eukprot:1263345-Prymnesium_polylepis.1